ncbi:MAG: hypothetical protein M3N54_15405 [Acidobacteriota bacterium]|nr:hypothetical protein [Acidobacteriota bacterium]
MNAEVRNLVWAPAVEPPAISRTPGLTARSTLNSAFLPLAERLRQLKSSRPDTVVVAFTASAPGAGVTYVVQNLALELARYTGERVVTTTPAALAPALEDCSPADDDPRSLNFATLREEYDYVLIDCPPVCDSCDAVLLGKISDGCVLVVDAGRTTRDQLRGAAMTLAQNSTTLLGYVLNKRTYPIPSFIHRWF